MSEVKILVASIIDFLKKQMEGETLNMDSRESLEVAVQCLESAFEVGREGDNTIKTVDLLALVRESLGHTEISSETKAEADKLKNEGNELMKADKYREALAKYTRALELDPRNAVYFCNRAAAHFKLGENQAAVADCTAALDIQPDYGKAHGRLGLALTALERHREARQAYFIASQLEPDNESYRTNLQCAEEALASSNRTGLDFGGLLQNPQLLNMATEMLSDPNMQNLISGIMGGSSVNVDLHAADDGTNNTGMSALLEAGQMLAQQMQASNPELVEQLRRQVQVQAQRQPPDGQRENPDQPPQQ